MSRFLTRISNVHRRWHSTFLCVAVAVVCLGACQTAEERGSSGGLLEEAHADIKRGDYGSALVKSSAYLKTPWGERPKEDRALFIAAYSSYRVGRAQHAMDHIRALRERHPQSSYNNRGLDQLETLVLAKMNSADQKQQEQAIQLAADTDRLEKLTGKEPANGQAHIDLGNLYWRAARFEDALAAYQVAAKIDENLLYQDPVRKRIRIDDDGRLSLQQGPVLGQHSGPLRVASLHVQRETRSAIRGETPDEHRYILTGEVINEDIRDHRAVSAIVAIYDFFGDIMETKTLQLGTIPAGARRPFYVNFQGFADAEFNVNRYDVQIYTGNRRTGGATGG